MFRKLMLCVVLVSLSLSLAANAQSASAKLTAAQIVDKSITARGGLQAWRAVETMTWKGKMDAGTGDSLERSRRYAQRGRVSPTSQMEHGEGDAAKGDPNHQVQLPFVLDVKRPRKSRLQIEFAGKSAVQVYDGNSGWKLRPFLNRNDVEPFTADELKSQSEQQELDGYLVDYAAKGSKVELEGTEKVEGHDAYKLKVTLKSGQERHVWIDAQNFLEVKESGAPRRMDGKMHNVYIYLRDYRAEHGLMMPHVFETAVDGYHDTHKMVIESVLVNPKLEDSEFTKPQAK